MNARHSSVQPNWETPEEYIELCRKALGGEISLDPFSCRSGNARIKATEYFGPDHDEEAKRDGFTNPWYGAGVFVNHPGRTTKRAWRKMVTEYATANFERGIWVGFSIEQICVLADVPIKPSDFSICFLRKRVPFIDPDKPDRPSRPAHANFIIGMGIPKSEFEAAFKGYGAFTHGYMSKESYRTVSK